MALTFRIFLTEGLVMLSLPLETPDEQDVAQSIKIGLEVDE